MLDKCFYYHVDQMGYLDCLLIIHVDDVLATYSETFPLETLENMVRWGSITKVTLDQPCDYRGKEITMHEKDGKLFYKVTQKSVIKSLTPGKLKPGRLQKYLKMDDDERKEFRSVCGCLQWLSGQS